MTFLPGFIASNKPEVVILLGDAGGVRKRPKGEKSDWEDTAKVCLRFGAVCAGESLRRPEFKS